MDERHTAVAHHLGLDLARCPVDRIEPRPLVFRAVAVGPKAARHRPAIRADLRIAVGPRGAALCRLCVRHHLVDVLAIGAAVVCAIVIWWTAACGRDLCGRVGAHLEAARLAHVVGLDRHGREEGELRTRGAHILVVDCFVGCVVANVDHCDCVDVALVTIARERRRQIDLTREVARPADVPAVAAQLPVEKRRGQIGHDTWHARHRRVVLRPWPVWPGPIPRHAKVMKPVFSLLVHGLGLQLRTRAVANIAPTCALR
mmetsp:Transcript_35872/g.94308  ORF Transcript_35872/g.94308 Transcript_35872/m.94308 type:complete len:258 (+) Transcript_35872:415-1188(+)